MSGESEWKVWQPLPDEWAKDLGFVKAHVRTLASMAAVSSKAKVEPWVASFRSQIALLVARGRRADAKALALRFTEEAFDRGLEAKAFGALHTALSGGLSLESNLVKVAHVIASHIDKYGRLPTRAEIIVELRYPNGATEEGHGMKEGAAKKAASEALRYFGLANHLPR